VVEDITIFALAERDDWVAAHRDGGLPSQSWDYAWGLSASGAVPQLAIVRAAGARMLLPFVERQWLGSTDISTILGISGASIAPDCGAPLALWHEFAASRGWVAGYIQLAVSVALEDCAFPGRLVANNTTFLFDLRNEPTPSSLSQAIRRKIRRVERIGAVLVDDIPILVEALQRLYPPAMRRLGAAPYFRFAPVTLARWAASPTAMILGAQVDGVIEAVYLCLLADGHAEFHIFAASEIGRGLSAWLIWQGMPRLRQRGATCLNLTGGMRPGDGLYRFKAGFSGAPTPRRAVHQVYDQVRYDELCLRSGATAGTGWFPAYRAPRESAAALSTQESVPP